MSNKAFSKELDDQRLLRKAVQDADKLQIDHTKILNLEVDSHLQYHNDERGDARYYTQAQIDQMIIDALASIEAEASTDASVTASGTAGATYTTAEQGIINALISDVAALKNSLNDLKAKMRTAGTLTP